VLPHSGLSTLPTTAPLHIDTRRFPWIRRLATDYAFDPGRLSDFFTGHPAEPNDWSAAIARAQRQPRQRAALADLIQAQQRTRGVPDEALAASATLRDPESVAIVTGQQAGLFGGPLFTLLKALTALRLAEDVRTRHRIPAVAVFWIDGEDHDWAEVRSCGLLDADLAFRATDAGTPGGADVSPVARVRLDPGISEAIETLAATLPPTEFTNDLLDGLRRAYQPGVGMADAFGRWLDAVLGPRGLVVYDAADPAAKPLAAATFAREVETAGETSRLAREAGARLEALGYHAQATPPEGSLALFHLNDSRDPIRAAGEGRFTIGDRSVSRADLLALIQRSPAEFSPSVLLRPIVQDTIFPTACYVSGPSELAYLGQLKQVYRLFGVPMPLIAQRATATIVDSNTMRFLARHDFPLESLRPRDEAALNELLGSQLPPDVDRELEQLPRVLDEHLARLATAVTSVDATLEGAVRSTLGRMQDDVKKLQGKIIHAAKKKDETLRRQFHHAQAQAFPEGEPQERALGFVYFLNKYGPVLIDRLSDVLPGAPGTHYVVTV
jgi:bacillithiol biosynthesis cysteine-adding enzyme BshC